MFDFHAYQTQYNQLRRSIDSLPQEYSRDLRIMLLNMDQLILHLKCEEVRCRQKRRVTDDYTQIAEKIAQYKDQLEQQLVLACLMS